MQILRFQAAVFFKDLAERPDLFYGNMPLDLQDLFDRIPNVSPVPPMPMPNGIPNAADLPVVTLQSSQMGYYGTIAKTRADLFYSYSATKNYSELLKTLSHYSELFIKYFYEKQGVNRVGVVLSAFIPEESAVKAIAKKYALRDLQGCEELAIRFNKREQKSGIQLNNIVNLHSDQISFGQQSLTSGVIVDCDINNVPKPVLLTGEQCETIFNFALERYAAEEVKKLIYVK